MCPNDCSVPDVHRSRVKRNDLLQLVVFRRPYRCLCCGLRFYKTEFWLVVVLALLITSIVLAGMLVPRAIAGSTRTTLPNRGTVVAAR